MDSLCSLADLKAYLEGRAADDAAHAARLAGQGHPLLPPAARAAGWTVADQRRFLETLAETGPVAAAAHAVGQSRLSAYRLRATAHPAFARAWKQAVRVAWFALRDAAMERAIAGRSVPLYSRGEVVGEQRVHDDRLVTFLLKTRGAHRVTEALAPAAPGQTPVREYVQDGRYDEYAMADFVQSLTLFHAAGDPAGFPDAPGVAPAAVIPRKPRPGPHRGSRNRRKSAGPR
jgi:hypothetical protein